MRRLAGGACGLFKKKCLKQNISLILQSIDFEHKTHKTSFFREGERERANIV